MHTPLSIQIQPGKDLEIIILHPIIPTRNKCFNKTPKRINSCPVICKQQIRTYINSYTYTNKYIPIQLLPTFVSKPKKTDAFESY